MKKILDIYFILHDLTFLTIKIALKNKHQQKQIKKVFSGRAQILFKKVQFQIIIQWGGDNSKIRSLQSQISILQSSLRERQQFQASQIKTVKKMQQFLREKHESDKYQQESLIQMQQLLKDKQLNEKKLKKDIQKQSNKISQLIFSQQEAKKIFSSTIKLQQQQMDHLKKEHKKVIEEMKKAQRPIEEIKQTKQIQLQAFLKFLGKKKWNQTLQNDVGLKNNVVVGNISTGKSSLLNTFFNLKLAVGIDQTTLEATPVHLNQEKKVAIWDSPGVNEEFDMYDLKTLKLFGTATKIFVLFNTSLKNGKDQARILYAVHPKDIYFVRTMGDHAEGEADLERALATDRSILQRWGINAPVYATSAKVTNFRDNEVVRQLISN